MTNFVAAKTIINSKEHFVVVIFSESKNLKSIGRF
jgi:hypothetical protein